MSLANRWWQVVLAIRLRFYVDYCFPLEVADSIMYYLTYVHIRWCSCRLTVTRRVSHVEQELLTLPEHLVVSGVRVVRFSVRLLFVLLSFWKLCSLSLFDLRLLVTPLVSFLRKAWRYNLQYETSSFTFSIWCLRYISLALILPVIILFVFEKI
jgi:hypothetical protein